VAGFELWSKWVQQPLVWLGMDDPFGGMTTMRAVDPTREELHQLIDVLKKYLADQEFTAADCKRLAEEQEYLFTGGIGRPQYIRQDLRDLMTIRGKLDAKAFGYVLRRHRGRIHAGYCIRIAPAQRDRVNVYSLHRAQKEEEGGGEAGN
jgi:hypothetical protein